LQAGDIIVAVDGDAVDARRTLPERLYAYDEGDVVTLTVRRGDEELAIEVTLGPASGGQFWGGMMGNMPSWGGGMGQGRGFNWGGQMGQFLDQHPFIDKFFGGRQNRGSGLEDLFGSGQMPETETEPAVPGSAA